MLAKIDVLDLMPALDELLIRLLEGLSPKDWERQTPATAVQRHFS